MSILSSEAAHCLLSSHIIILIPPVNFVSWKELVSQVIKKTLPYSSSSPITRHSISFQPNLMNEPLTQLQRRQSCDSNLVTANSEDIINKTLEPISNTNNVNSTQTLTENDNNFNQEHHKNQILDNTSSFPTNNFHMLNATWINPRCQLFQGELLQCGILLLPDNSKNHLFQSTVETFSLKEDGSSLIPILPLEYDVPLPEAPIGWIQSTLALIDASLQVSVFHPNIHQDPQCSVTLPCLSNSTSSQLGDPSYKGIQSTTSLSFDFCRVQSWPINTSTDKHNLQRWRLPSDSGIFLECTLPLTIDLEYLDSPLKLEVVFQNRVLSNQPLTSNSSHLLPSDIVAVSSVKDFLLNTFQPTISSAHSLTSFVPPNWGVPWALGGSASQGISRLLTRSVLPNPSALENSSFSLNGTSKIHYFQPIDNLHLKSVYCVISVTRPFRVASNIVGDIDVAIELTNVDGTTTLEIQGCYMKHATTSSEGDFPIILGPNDKYSLLFNLDKSFLSSSTPTFLWNDAISSYPNGMTKKQQNVKILRTVPSDKEDINEKFLDSTANLAINTDHTDHTDHVLKPAAMLPFGIRWKIQNTELTCPVWSQYITEIPLPCNTPPLQISLSYPGLTKQGPNGIFSVSIIMYIGNNTNETVDLHLRFPNVVSNTMDAYLDFKKTSDKKNILNQPNLNEENHQISIQTLYELPDPLIAPHRIGVFPRQLERSIGFIRSGAFSHIELEFVSSQVGLQPLPLMSIEDRITRRSFIFSCGYVTIN